MRKITSIILLICLLMSCCMAVTARTSEAEILRIDEKNNTRYIVYCKNGGKHYMQSNGWADVYNGVYPNGTLKWQNVPKYQCKYCNVLIVTRYEVSASRAIGEYTIWHQQEPQPTFTVLYTKNFYNEPSKTLSGYEFH